MKPLGQKTSPKTARHLKRLRCIEELPPAVQRVVLKLVRRHAGDAMAYGASDADEEEGVLTAAEKKAR